MAKKYKDAFGDRQKRYEAVTNISLMRRCPVVLRCDGNAFHTFTRGFEKPFDKIMMATMQKTMKALCESIQGCVFGYVQSDEITLVLCDYQTLDTAAWFDYRLEKLCSVGASMASRYFNKFFIETVNEEMMKPENAGKKFDTYTRKFFCADFDCRAFNVPVDDVCNNVLWRQKDAEKNSIQMLAQSLYKQKEINGISTKKLQDKMFTEKGVNWNDLPVPCKRGTACVKDDNGKWFVDYEMPIISADRDYVEKRIRFEEE